MMLIFVFLYDGLFFNFFPREHEFGTDGKVPPNSFIFDIQYVKNIQFIIFQSHSWKSNN